MLTKEHFADLLMESAKAKRGDRNSFYVILPSDDEFPYDIVANFFYEKERIVFIAHTIKMRLEPYDVAKAIAFCNRINQKYLNQSVYYYAETNELRMSGCLFTDFDISDEYIQKNFIEFYLLAAENFFKEAIEKFPPKT